MFFEYKKMRLLNWGTSVIPELKKLFSAKKREKKRAPKNGFSFFIQFSILLIRRQPKKSP